MKCVVVVYVSRDGIEVERATDDEAQARQWIAENPLHMSEEGVYELWEAEPGTQPTKICEIWGEESQNMHRAHLNPR